MDFENLIQEKRNEILSLNPDSSIDVVLKHLNAAEKHFTNARETNENYLFSDVIYRTNQVFEGIMKESYEVLAGKSSTKLTPHKIEVFLTKNDIFSTRVIEYFTRYRTDWRNTSTHDYQLSFDESEAFLALTTVSAFCYVALDQILQRLVSDTIPSIVSHTSKSNITSSMESTIEFFAVTLKEVFQNLRLEHFGNNRIREVYVTGAISGICHRIWGKESTLKYNEVLEHDGRRIVPDLVVTASGMTLAIELKSSKLNYGSISRVKERLKPQLRSMSDSNKVSASLAVIFPSDEIPEELNFSVSKEKFATSEKEYTNFIIYPDF